MEESQQVVKPTRTEYFKNYQRNRYADDYEFREKKKAMVRERYHKKMELLRTLQNKLKEDSQPIV